MNGFDLTPHRTTRVLARRKASRTGFGLAVLGGLCAAVLLDMAAARQKRADDARLGQLEQRFAALSEDVSEVERLETLIHADDVQRARLSALEPKRFRLTRLFEVLTAVAEDGIAVTEAALHEAEDSARAEGDESAGNAGGVIVDGVAELATSVLVRVSGLADDADVLARWATRLAEQDGVDAVQLDAVRRVKPQRALAPMPLPDGRRARADAVVDTFGVGRAAPLPDTFDTADAAGLRDAGEMSGLHSEDRLIQMPPPSSPPPPLPPRPRFPLLPAMLSNGSPLQGLTLFQVTFRLIEPVVVTPDPRVAS